MQDPAATDWFKLPASLDHAAAENFLVLMRDRLAAQPRLQLDASEVETLTLPCVQIMLSAQLSCGAISIANPSDAFISAFKDLGLDCAKLFAASAAEEGGTIGDGAATERKEDSSADEPAEPPKEAQELAMARRILTIDDSKTIRDMLMLTLADAGFEVLQAIDGQDGLDVLDKEKVDLVITDINMPRMDGYEVIRQLRRNTAYKSLPILVLTTESEKEKKNLAREAGATGWMVKPFDPDRLIATINKVAP